MSISKNRLFLILISLTIFSLFYCTSNPFGSDDVSSQGRKLTGTVALSDNVNPDNVYIWLGAIDVGTYSDSNGEFKLMLPPASSQSGGGITGHFNLYFYVANYNVDTASVVIHKGIIQTGQGDVNEDGKIKNTIILKKLINVSLYTSPAAYPDFTGYNKAIQEYCHSFTGYEEPLTVLTELSSTANSSIIKYPNVTQGPSSIIFFKNIDPDQNSTKMLTISENTVDAELTSDEITTNSKIWITGFQLEPGMLPKGKYQIIPYFLIQQNAIPEELLNNLCADIETPGLDFINIPMKLSGGILEITK